MAELGRRDRAAIATYMNRLSVVRWDRLTYQPPQSERGLWFLDVYGWVDRDDGRADFTVLQFSNAWPAPQVLTSSAEHSAEFCRLLYGEGGDHFECERVEDVLGELVHNRIVLEADHG